MQIAYSQKLRTEIESLLATRKQAIQEQLKLQLAKQKNAVEQYLEIGIQILDGRLHPVEEQIETPKGATPNEKDFNITEGETGYSYDVLFGPYLATANSIYIKEPYLRFRYQLDNFPTFLRIGHQKRCYSAD